MLLLIREIVVHTLLIVGIMAAEEVYVMQQEQGIGHLIGHDDGDMPGHRAQGSRCEGSHGGKKGQHRLGPQPPDREELHVYEGDQREGEQIGLRHGDSHDHQPCSEVGHDVGLDKVLGQEGKAIDNEGGSHNAPCPGIACQGFTASIGHAPHGYAQREHHAGSQKKAYDVIGKVDEMSHGLL